MSIMAIRHTFVLSVHYVVFLCFPIKLLTSQDDRDIETSASFQTGSEYVMWKYFKPTNSAYPKSGVKHRMTRNFYYLSEFIVGLLLLCGDIHCHPGPIAINNRISSNFMYKSLVINAHSLKSLHQVGASTVCNPHCVQDLVYADNSDIVFINETWLICNIRSKEIFHPPYTIVRKDQTNQSGGGVCIAIKEDSFKSVRGYTAVSSEQLEVASAEVVTDCGLKILACSIYRPPNADASWIEQFNAFLDSIADQYNNIILAGDFNLPHISWEQTVRASGNNELCFVEALNDHYLSQLNHTPTRGNNVLDLVITSMPDRIRACEVLSPADAGIYSDHGVISFDFSAFVKAPTKIHRTIYDYKSGDFGRLRGSLTAVNLSSVLGSNDINLDWQCWKDAFLAAVSDSIPTKKLKGRNPMPWINGTISNLIKKKDTLRKRLRKSPTLHLKDKFRKLRTEVKQLIQASREEFFNSLEVDIKENPKRFWSIFKQTSKSLSVPNYVSMPGTGTTEEDLARVVANTPQTITNLFNEYFASIFTESSLEVNNSFETNCEPLLSDMALMESEVQTVLQTSDVSKAAGVDNIPARLLHHRFVSYFISPFN